MTGSLRKAVLVLVDGIPLDVLESARTPHIDAISAAGAFGEAWTGGERGGPTESPTISGCCYQSLLTGTWANKHNVWDNEIANPDYRYWDLFRIARHARPALSTAVFSTWLENRTRLLGDGLPEAGGPKIDIAVDGLELDTVRYPHFPDARHIEQIDAAVAASAAASIAREAPDLSWVYLQYTDDVGHRHGDGPEMVAAVETTDALIGRVWAAVAARQAETAEDWLILVTTDHGRDPETGRHHGRQSDRERQTWIATNSEHCAPRFLERPAIVDIMPSILTHLECDIPPAVAGQLDGCSFINPA